MKAVFTQQKGAALLTVLLLVSLLSFTAVAVMDDMRFALYRIKNVQNRDQGHWYALGAEQLALAELGAIWRASDGEIPIKEDQPRTFRFALENGLIEARVEEASNCFNINSLVEEVEDGNYSRNDLHIAQYRDLLQTLDVGQADYLVDGTIDWLIGGRVDGRHGRLFVDVSELRQINGYEQDIYLLLAPYLCAFSKPEAAVLNINSLSPERAVLLYMILPDIMNLDQARNILSDRPDRGYDSLESFFARPIFAESELYNQTHPQFGLAPHHLKLHGRVVQGESQHFILSLLSIEAGGQIRLRDRRFTLGEDWRTF